MAFYDSILSFEGIFTNLMYLSYPKGHVLVLFADTSRTFGKTDMALTQRGFSNSAKTSAIWKEKTKKKL